MGLVLEAVDYRDVGHWRWRLTSPEGAFLADHEVSLEAGEAEYEGFINLGAYVRHQTDPERPVESERDAVRRVGEWLGRKVLGEVGRAMVAEAPVVVRVKVPAGADELLYRPLELGHVGGRPLAVQDVSLVLEPSTGSAPAKRAIGDRLRMLAVFSLPTGQSPLGLRAERRALNELAVEIGGRYGRAVELRVLQYGVTRERLRDVLEEGEGWDVVHFSGHGLPGGLVLEEADGSEDVVATGEMLSLLWPGRRQLKLVTLSSCSSGAATAARTLRQLGIEPPRAGGVEAEESIRPLPALAARLVGELGCAVLAMRYPVLDEFAVRLVLELYDRLLRQRQPLARALQLALPRAAGEEPEPGRPAISVATPALFGALAGELELELPAAAGLKFDEGRLRTAGLPPEPERLVGRTGALARASAALAPRSGRSGVLFLGMAGGGKTTCAVELVYRHRENYRAVAWYKAPDEGSEIGGALGELAMELEARVPGLRLSHLVERPDEMKGQLPQLRQFFVEQAVLVVVDNVESLLSDGGSWRDDRWGLLLSALMGQRGLSRLVLTSRRRPPPLDEGMLVESIHALSLEESVLLARQLPNLGALLRGRAPVAAARGRELVARTLGVVQGHPKLIELAEGAAGKPEVLEERLGEAERAVDGRRLRAFFETGETAVKEVEQLGQLEGWARAAAAGLEEGSRTLFWMLCCLEEADRLDSVLRSNWGDLWRRLGREGEVPELEVALGPLWERALVESVEVEKGSEERYHRLHPAVTEAGRGQVGEGFQDAVDRELAAYWVRGYRRGLEKEAEGDLVVLAGRRGAPYLVRLEEWAIAGEMLDNALLRDRSPAMLAALLPRLRLIAEASTGSEHELPSAGRLARVLSDLGSEEAEPMLRQLVGRALQRGENGTASAGTADLFKLLHRTGRLREALAEAERMLEFGARAGLGPWTLLAGDRMRLEALDALGEHERVLGEVDALRRRMADLHEVAGENETVAPWMAREGILSAGLSAATRLERWDQALTFVEEIRESERRRQAPIPEQARTAFNAHGALLGLGRLEEARTLLDWCRQVFDQEHDADGLGAVFGAVAQIEHRRSHHLDAIEFTERALRYAYLTGQVEDIAARHNNLAVSLTAAGAAHELTLAHSLAAVIIDRQTASGRLQAHLTNLRGDLSNPGAEALLPATFEALCQCLEAMPGVRFRELFQQLSPNAADGDRHLADVVELARQHPDTAVQQHLEQWQPVIDALVAACRAGKPAGQNLLGLLGELAQRQEWAALAAAIHRVLDGERERTALLDGLDPIDTAILSRILSNL